MTIQYIYVTGLKTQTAKQESVLIENKDLIKILPSFLLDF